MTTSRVAVTAAVLLFAVSSPRAALVTAAGSCVASPAADTFWDHSKCGHSNVSRSGSCCETEWGLQSAEACCTECQGSSFGFACVAWEYTEKTQTCYMCSAEVLPYRGRMAGHSTGCLEGLCNSSTVKQQSPPPPPASTPSPARHVNWWMGFNSPANNLKLIDAHRGAITGLYTYIGAGVEASGSCSCAHNATYLRSRFAPYWARGLTVTPALALSNASVTSGNAKQHVAEVAALAQRLNVSGFMLDFEPSTSDAAWVTAYADYVAAFVAAMHGVGLRAEMCVSGWGILDGHALPNHEGYGVYAATGVDAMQSMSSTYFGTNVTKNLHNVDTELRQGVSLAQLSAGIGTQIDPQLDPACPAVGPMGCKIPGGQCYEWDEAKLRSFVGSLVERKVSTLTMWRADIDAEGDCTEPYYFAVAEAFLQGQGRAGLTGAGAGALQQQLLHGEDEEKGARRTAETGPAYSSFSSFPSTNGAASSTAATRPTVVTQWGIVEGSKGSKGSKGGDNSIQFDQFLNIPYASPPVHALRFADPVDWSSVYPGGRFDATRFGIQCPQLSGNASVGSEDCLMLNIWRPQHSTRGSTRSTRSTHSDSGKATTRTSTSRPPSLPVLFFVHGGNFVNGNGDQYNASRLAIKHNVLVVTINYRLGHLGWLAPVLGHANFGLKDQRSALRWVQSNIAAFGGDPVRVSRRVVYIWSLRLTCRVGHRILLENISLFFRVKMR